MLTSMTLHYRIFEFNNLQSKFSPFPFSRYKLLRYEDFVDNPLGALMSVFSYLGLEFTPESAREVEAHVNAKERRREEAESMYRYNVN